MTQFREFGMDVVSSGPLLAGRHSLALWLPPRAMGSPADHARPIARMLSRSSHAEDGLTRSIPWFLCSVIGSARERAEGVLSTIPSNQVPRT